MPRLDTPTATLIAALALAVCLLLPCLGPAALAAGPAPCPPARTIEVEGVGEVALAPTVGRANLQVEANAPSAAKALEKMSAATSHVMAALKPKGCWLCAGGDYDLATAKAFLDEVQRWAAGKK